MIFMNYGGLSICVPVQQVSLGEHGVSVVAVLEAQDQGRPPSHLTSDKQTGTEQKQEKEMTPQKQNKLKM